MRGGVSAGIPDRISSGSIYGYGSLTGTIDLALADGGKVYLADLPTYSGGVQATGSLSYDLGIGISYDAWVGHDHHVGPVVYTAYSWESVTHQESFGSGTFYL